MKMHEQQMCTFHGLHEWHNHMLEKLGWMLLAKHHNNQLKIEAYMESLEKLLECISDKHKHTSDTDRQDDLMILKHNLLCIKSCMKKLIEMDLEEGDTSRDVNKERAHAATNCGLAHWMRSKFEKLG